MPLARTPLDPASLSDAARKALGAPGAMKMMAARGLAPLPRPADLASVVYQLALDADAAVKAAAEKTAGELPEKILAGALADPTMDPRVLDFFAAKLGARSALLEPLVLNKATADETIVDLARHVGEREIEIIASNETRLLRHPAIIGALYMNPKARMSTVDRACELAVRNNIVVPGIPAWDQVVAAVLGTKGAPAPATADVDAAFAAAAAVGVGEGAMAETVAKKLEEVEEAAAKAGTLGADAAESQAVDAAKEKLQVSKLSIPAKIRLATLGNAFARSLLIRDSNKTVALAAIKSPGVTDSEVVKYSGNRALSDDVVREIATARDWTKIYQVKVNLVNNPKCPLQTSMRFLPFLHEKDLRNIARSKGVPSALVAQARKLISQRGGKE